MKHLSIALTMFATAFAAAPAFAQTPLHREESPFSEFVYERLGATPSIRFGTTRKPNSRDAAKAAEAVAKDRAAACTKTAAQPADAAKTAAACAPEVQL